jgi:hypothetical protein
MRCKHPIRTKNTGYESVHACGQCLNCRIDERRVKTHRMMLEASSHEHNSFLTLTYNDENLPKEFHNEKTGEVYSDNSVNPADVKAFIKNLQTDVKRKFGVKIKYFICGEYGEKTNRPHYHIALFGYPACTTPDKQRVKRGKFIPCDCANCQYLARKWKKGHIYLGSLTQDSAQYVAGYVTKKLTSNTSDHQKKILQGRYPEFARMSLKPALGKEAIIKHALSKKRYIKSASDIPKYLVHNGKKWPLGRYLTDVYKKTLNFQEIDTKAHKARKRHDQVLNLFKDKTLTPAQKQMVINGIPEAAVELLNAQRVLQVEKRHKLKNLNKKGL